jgi:SSS family transporter
MVKVTETGLVLVYFIVVLAIGFHFRHRRSADEYWSADGSVGTFMNTIAIFAAYASGGTFLGAIGVVYALGVPLWWAAAIGSVVGFLFAAVLVAKPLRRLQAHTLPDIFKYLFDDTRINVIVPVVILIGYFMYVVAQLHAAGLVSEFLLGIDYVPAVTIVGLVFVLYVAVGGMWAITITDFLQGLLMLTLLGVVWTISFGYFGWSFRAPTVETPRVMGTGQLPIQTFIGFAVIWAAAVTILPHIVMRAFSARSPQSAKRAYAWVGLLYIVITLPFVHIAGVAISLDPDLANPDLALILVMESILPTVIAGFTAAVILAAVMSSTDALLLAMAAGVANDLYGNVINPDASEARIVRIGVWSAVGVGLLAIVASWRPPELLVALYTDGTGLMGAAFFFPLVLGVWWKRMNRVGALAGIIAGIVAYAGFYLVVPMFAAIIYALPISLAACVGGALASPSRPPKEIERLSRELGHERAGW